MQKMKAEKRQSNRDAPDKEIQSRVDLDSRSISMCQRYLGTGVYMVWQRMPGPSLLLYLWLSDSRETRYRRPRTVPQRLKIAKAVWSSVSNSVPVVLP